MRMRLAFLALGILACHVDAPHYYGLDGSPSSDASDGVDAPNAPDAMIDANTIDPGAGPWSTPTILNIHAKIDRPPKPSYDDLYLYFTEPNVDDIYYVHRSQTSQSWGSEMDLTTLNSSGPDDNPTPSADGLELYLERKPDIYVSKRATPTDSWPMPVPTGLQGYDVDILSDGLTMYYSDSTASCPVYTCRVRVTRANKGAAWGNPMQETISNDSSDYSIVDFSGDGLHALLSYPADPVFPSVAIASRTSLSAGWGPTVPLNGIAQQAGTTGDWLSASWNWPETDIYLVRAVTGNPVYVSHLQ